MRNSVVLVGWLTAFVAGIVFGRWSTLPRSQEVHQENNTVVVDPVVCVQAPLQQRSRPDADEANLAHAWCVSQLEALQHQSRAARLEWPAHEDYGLAERPDVWITAMEQVFQQCDLPAQNVFTDCSEPPCVAALRADSSEEVMSALADCPAFQQTFESPEMGVIPMSVGCADGSVEVMHLLTTFTTHERMAYFEDQGWMSHFQEETLDSLAEGYRIIGRRADALAGFWECGDP